MRAMVLAAGLGTRLLPLTRLRPKCLMPVMNRPLLGPWLDRLANLEVARAVVNTHHLAPQVRSFLERAAQPGLELKESFEPQILGTGGGLVAARDLLGPEPFLLVNADVVSAADLAPLAQAQAASGALAVLGLTDAPRFNTVALDPAGRVRGFKGQGPAPADVRWLTYTGLAVIHPRLLDHLPPVGYSTLVQGLLAALAAGQPVLGLEMAGFWDDLGTPQALLDLHRALVGSPPAGLARLADPGPLILDESARVEPGAALEGFVVLGAGARVAAGAWVKDSLLLPGAQVTPGARVEQAVLGDGFVARGDISGGAHA